MSVGGRKETFSGDRDVVTLALVMLPGFISPDLDVDLKGVLRNPGDQSKSKEQDVGEHDDVRGPVIRHL